MEEPSEITISNVSRFLESNGGRSTNQELVSHFRKLLNDPLRQAEFRLQFKDIVNTIASVHEEHGSKYICLKKQYFGYCGDVPHEPPNAEQNAKENGQYPQSYQPYWRYRLSFNTSLIPPVPLPATILTASKEGNNSLSSTSLHQANRRRSMQDVDFKKFDSYEDCNSQPPRNRSRSLYQMVSLETNPIHTRRKSSGNENEMQFSSSMKLKERPFEIQSLPDTLNSSGVLRPTTNNVIAEPSPDLFFKCVNKTSPNKRPSPVCLSDEKLDSLLLRDSLGQASTGVNHSSFIPHSHIDNHQEVNHTPVTPIASSESKLQHMEPIKTEYKQMENFPPEFDSKDNVFEEIKANLELQQTGSEISVKTNPELEEVRLHSGSVRERAQMIDTIAAQVTASITSNGLSPRRSSPRAKNNRIDKFVPEDNASIVSLDSKLRRQWFIKAAKADYHGLVGLLKKEPRLAGIRDIASGFTALHWAAKHGNADVVKLIAGAHKVSPNLKSNGGYTCIHLATLYKHKTIVDLLLKTYGANPTIRDNSGKRADQYPENYVSFTVGVVRKPPKPAAVTATSPSSLDHIEIPANGKRILVRPADDPSSSFIRIGSLNLKVSRTRGVFASVRGSSVRLKTWNSEDNVNETWSSGASEKIVIPKKKKSKKKNADIPSIESASSKQDPDSDSAYGFHS